MQRTLSLLRGRPALPRRTRSGKRLTPVLSAATRLPTAPAYTNNQNFAASAASLVSSMHMF